MALDARWKIHTLWLLALLLILHPAYAQEENKAKEAKKPENEQYYELLQTFVDTFEQVERNYVKDVDRKKLMEAAIRGMLSELDPYSSYIPSEELKRFNRVVRQEFGGIGIQVQTDPRTKRILVISPLPDTPAYHAGVRAGDLVMKVEGQDTANMSIDEAVKLMTGPPGDPVTIVVRHIGSAAEETIEITRDIIKVKSVLGDTYDKDGQWDFMIDKENSIAYVRLTQFGNRSATELAAAIRKLQEGGMKGLVLDLRNNPGGLLTQAVQISDMFIDSGTIVSTAGKNSQPKTWSATKDGTFKEFPMAILVNRFSASASEIVSACLQDHKRAVVVGERSWGKGSVQNIIQLDSGASALKLTTAGYKRPSGKNIHRFPDSKPDDEWGVTPDDGYAIRFSRDELRSFDSYRRERDVLRAEGPPESDFKDRQLDKAIEYVRSKLDDDGNETESDKKPAEEKKAA